MINQTDLKNEVKVTFIGFPEIYDYFNTSQLQFSFKGSLKDLLFNLINTYGGSIERSLLDERSNNFDPTIQVSVNGIFVKTHFEKFELKSGDQITIMKLIAGG